MIFGNKELWISLLRKLWFQLGIFSKYADTLGKKYQVNNSVFEDWFCNTNCSHNGCYSYINVKEDLEYKKTRPEINKFLQLLLDEFGEEEMRVWISW